MAAGPERHDQAHLVTQHLQMRLPDLATAVTHAVQEQLDVCDAYARLWDGLNDACGRAICEALKLLDHISEPFVAREVARKLPRGQLLAFDPTPSQGGHQPLSQVSRRFFGAGCQEAAPWSTSHRYFPLKCGLPPPFLFQSRAASGNLCFLGSPSRPFQRRLSIYSRPALSMHLYRNYQL